MNLVILTKFY